MIRPLLSSVLLFAAFLATPSLAIGTDVEPAVEGGSCVPSTTVLCFLDNRFSVEVDWEDFDMNTGAGQTLPVVAGDSGFFWFTDAEKPELYVKVLDGTAINSRYWVLYGALSNWQYTVTVTDTVTSMQAIYMNPLGTFASVADTDALPGDPPSTGAVPSSYRGAQTQEQELGPLVCVPGSTTLCLDAERFQVEVEWQDFGGSTGSGLASGLTDLAGYFSFFSSAVDLAVKIFDGGDGNFWFYFGATTDIAYTITVTDVCTGNLKQYANPLGVLSSVGDFTAFPATPACNAEIFSDGFESGDTLAW